MNQTSDVLPQDQGSPSDTWAPGYEFLICNKVKPGQVLTQENGERIDVAQCSLHSRCSTLVFIIILSTALQKTEKKYSVNISP